MAPVRSQNAPVAGDQSKLNATHTEKPTRAALSPATYGCDRLLHAVRNTTNKTQPNAASPSTPCVAATSSGPEWMRSNVTRLA